jgi:hypothetical protein
MLAPDASTDQLYARSARAGRSALLPKYPPGLAAARRALDDLASTSVSELKKHEALNGDEGTTTLGQRARHGRVEDRETSRVISVLSSIRLRLQGSEHVPQAAK